MEEPSQQLAQERSGLDTAAAAAYLYDLHRKRRKPNFTEPELQTLVELWAQYKTILRGPATDTVMRSTKARVWRKITDEMNRRYPFVLRRVCDIRGKWEKLMCEARACLKVRGLQPCRDQPAASTQRKRPSRILRRIMAINWPQETDLIPDMDTGQSTQMLHARQQKIQPLPTMQQQNMQPLQTMQQQQQMQPLPTLQQQPKMQPMPSLQQQQQPKIQPAPTLQQQQQQQPKIQSMPSMSPQLSVQPLPTLQHQQQALQNQSCSIIDMQQQSLQQQQQHQQQQRQPLQQHSLQQHQQSLQQRQSSPQHSLQQQHHHHQQHLHLQQSQQNHLQQAKHIQQPQTQHKQQEHQSQIPTSSFPIVEIKEDPDELRMDLNSSAETQGLTDADLPGQFPSLLGLSSCPDEAEDEGALRREVLRLQRTKLLKEIEKLDLELALLRRQQQQQDKP